MGLFNWLFRKLCKAVFKKVDRNGNGKIEEIEVEVAVLYLYNVINKRLPGWQDPPTREQIQAALKAYDVDANQTLDLDEFTEFAKSMVNSGPDAFFARIGKNAMLHTAILPGAALAAHQVGLKAVPLAILAPALGSIFRAVRALVPV